MTPLEALRPFAQALADWGDEPEIAGNRDVWEHPLAMLVTLDDFRNAALVLASADTHPKGGDVQQAPSLMGSAVPKADARKDHP